MTAREPLIRIHLIDGTYELFRCFFGAPSYRNTQGLEVGASRAFLRSLNNLLKEPTVTHVGCAFDHVIESFRNDLFDGYKTGEGLEPEILDQFPLVERGAAALGVVCWPMVEFEADDALATAAHKFAQDPAVEQVIVATPDKDLAQVVKDDRIILWDRRREISYDREGVIKKFGVPPASIPDWLALVGDAADGIPGIPKWGAKSAATVLQEFGHIEQIPLEIEWAFKVRGAKSLQATLSTQLEDALLFRKLATLRLDTPVNEDVDDMLWRGCMPKLLESLCDELEIRDFDPAQP